MPLADGPALPMVFDISVGVRRDNITLPRQLEAALTRRASEIQAVLRDCGVPLLDGP